jgi:WD40 repeat protein/serine/threonine protein kinase
MLNRTISHYQIVERLGTSGMGEVYKAEDLKLKRTVALKFLPHDLLANDETKQYLLEEAQAAAALNHPNIATIYELGQFHGLSFIVMECIDGVTLSRKIEQGQIGIITALDIAIEVAEALGATHERGLLHCDIKSSNIMLTEGGKVKVLDFGLARLAGTEDLGSVMGTPGYMSPEQARAEQLDARTDIFSLGIVIFEMATGRLPFEGDNATALLHSLLNDEPATIGNYRNDSPLELESIIIRALEKDRDERYQSVGEILSDLRRLREKLGTGAISKITVQDELLQSSSDRPSLWQRLIASLRRNGQQAIRSMPKGMAFRGLLPFQEADRDRFYGREIETLSLFEMITHKEYRFGVLFGESGCGKTSLLRAGLVPRLWEEEYLPIYCRSYRDPLAALLEECRGRSQIKPREGEPPIDYLRRVAEGLSTCIFIICDQFEEFFINFRTEQERESFLSFVTACYHQANLPVKFLFSMRSDFLYLINSEFSGRVPEPLMSPVSHMGSRLYHLRNFDRARAEEIIERSAERANLILEEGLSRQVARDLADNGSVLPSELQIVGEQLQNRRIFTLQEYGRAGGKESLVHGFLEDVIQASGDREAAQLLLRSLISDENTRLTLPLDEIAKRTQRSRQKVEQILYLFVESRLIRQIQEEEPWCYELIHEYLIEKINQITGKVMDATQRANRLFRQYLSSYSVEKRTRIPLGRLWTINRYSDLKRGEREQELLRKSLRWGIAKWSVAVVLLAIATTLAAAALSVSEEWESSRLSDGHRAAVREVAFSPDGRLLVSASEDKKVIVWDFAQRKQLATLTDHTDNVTTVAFSPDGKQFATGSNDHTIIIWDRERLKKVEVLREQSGAISHVEFSPDGHLLISAFPDRTIVLETSRWSKIYEMSSEDSFFPLFSADGRRLISTTGKSWDTKTGERLTDALETPINLNLYKAVLSPDGRRLVGVNSDGVVLFLDPIGRKILGHYRVHEDHARAVAFSPDGRFVASGGDDIVLWDVETQTIILHLEHTAGVWGLTFSPNGGSLVSSHADGAILVWDMKERKLAANFNEHSAPVLDVAFSPDGKRLATASQDRSVIVWNLENGRKEAVLEGHSMRVTAVVFSPDGRSIASSDYNDRLILWDLAEQRPRWSKVIGTNYCLAFSPDGRRLAISGRVLDSADGREISFFSRTCYGFSISGKKLACVSIDYGEIITLWDAENWQMIDKLKLNNPTLLAVSFSPDGKWIVTGSGDGLLQLWSASPLRLEAIIGQHAAPVKSVAFSPDSRQVASASDDQTIALWDLSRRSLITRIGSHTAPVGALTFSPDGRMLATGEQDRSVRLYTRHRILWGYRLD